MQRTIRLAIWDDGRVFTAATAVFLAVGGSDLLGDFGCRNDTFSVLGTILGRPCRQRGDGGILGQPRLFEMHRQAEA